MRRRCLNLEASQSATADHPVQAQPPAAGSEPAAPAQTRQSGFEFYTKLPEGGQPVTDIQPGTQPVLETPAAAQPPATTTPPPAVAENLDPIQQLLAEKEAAKVEPTPVAVVKPEPAKPEPKLDAAKPEAAKPVTAKAPAKRTLSASWGVP